MMTASDVCKIRGKVAGDRMKRLAIIGGGAAGLAAAISAMREAKRELNQSCGNVDESSEGLPDRIPFDVVLYEADERVGRSILATGNGRCNFSNAHIDAAVYHHAKFVEAALHELANWRGSQGCELESRKLEGDPVCEFFESLGLVWREESEGRLYPLANKASSVLDVLRTQADRAGVRMHCSQRVVRIDPSQHAGECFHIHFDNGEVVPAEAVIVAVGGVPARGLMPSAIACAKPRAVLGPLCTDVAPIRKLNNIRVRCTVSLVEPGGRVKARERGEVLFRDYGVSGIAVFNLSRFAQPGDMLCIDFLPHIPADTSERFMAERYKCIALDVNKPTGEDLLRGMVLPAVADAVLRAAGLKPNRALTKRDIPLLAHVLKAFSLEVRGIGDARQCQVHRGGADVAAFDPCTMEAHRVPGFYVVGEALDVDAPCGGYNLHWAWASGMLAGRSAARVLRKEDVC